MQYLIQNNNLQKNTYRQCRKITCQKKNYNKIGKSMLNSIKKLLISIKIKNKISIKFNPKYFKKEILF